jgi:hypothetical protein
MLYKREIKLADGKTVYSGENCHPFRLKVYHFYSLNISGYLKSASGSFQPERFFGFFLMESPSISI